MCISDWPKRFLKTILLHLSRHQVCAPPGWACLPPLERPAVSWREEDVTIFVFFFQVELLIENEAEKDYLFDVLRMYHQ